MLLPGAVCFPNSCASYMREYSPTPTGGNELNPPGELILIIIRSFFCFVDFSSYDGEPPLKELSVQSKIVRKAEIPVSPHFFERSFRPQRYDD